MDDMPAVEVVDWLPPDDAYLVAAGSNPQSESNLPFRVVKLADGSEAFVAQIPPLLRSRPHGILRDFR